MQIDEPKFRASIDQNFLPNVKGFYYMRLHGRNAKEWWKHAKSEDRYNYLYSGEELDEFVGVADAVRSAREEDVSLHEQSLRGEGGGQRRDAEGAAWPAGRWGLSGRIPGALSRNPRHRAARLRGGAGGGSQRPRKKSRAPAKSRKGPRSPSLF